MKRKHRGIESYQTRRGTFYKAIADVKCPNSGKRKQMSKSGIKSIPDAIRIQVELEDKARDILGGKISSHTWQSWCYEYISLISFELKESTVDSYKTVISKTENAFNGEKLDEISTSDVSKLIFEIDVKSEKTRKKYLQQIKRIFEKAVEEKIISSNPASKISIKVQETELKALNSNEVQILLRKAQEQNHEWFPIWVVALFSGLRSGELYALKKSNVDLLNKEIKVVEAWTKKDGFTSTKNKKNRIVPISDSLIPFLQKIILSSEPESPFLLPRLSKWTSGEQAKILRHFCEEINITSVRFHDLRSTFIVQMLRSGVSSADVMKIVGHSSLKVTDRYVRISGIELIGATNSLPFNIPMETISGSAEGVHQLHIVPSV